MRKISLVITPLLMLLTTSCLHPVEHHEKGVAYFIEGRLRTTELIRNTAPFKVNVIYLDSNLYNTKIGFNALDSNHYHIEYSKGTLTFTRYGTFDSNLVNNDMKLNITLDKSLTKNSLDQLMQMRYTFEVFN